MLLGLKSLDQVSLITFKNRFNLGRVLMLQREIPEYVNIAAARVAREAGTTVILDIGGRDEPLSEELLNLVHMISPNETELDRVIGKKVTNY